MPCSWVKPRAVKSCLVLGDGTVRVSLDLEHPLDVYNLATSGFDYKAPRLTLLKRSVFHVDISLPINTLSVPQGLLVGSYNVYAIRARNI